MAKHYTITSLTVPPLTVFKWLRSKEELNKDFIVLAVNYNRIQIEFKNSKLELEYIMKYDWLLT